MTDAKYAKLTYLDSLSELQVEGNDTHALQPGREARPRAPTFRLLLESGRTGTVQRVHHSRL